MRRSSIQPNHQKKTKQLDSLPLTITRQLRDVNLTKLACDAAIEIDNILLGRNKGIEAVTELSELLAAIFSDQESDDTSPVWLIFPSLIAINKAVHDVSEGSASRMPQGALSAKGLSISRNLNRLGVASDILQFNEDELKSAKRFCLYLSKESSNQQLNRMSMVDSQWG